jgi:hypothetical protein
MAIHSTILHPLAMREVAATPQISRRNVQRLTTIWQIAFLSTLPVENGSAML